MTPVCADLHELVMVNGLSQRASEYGSRRFDAEPGGDPRHDLAAPPSQII